MSMPIRKEELDAALNFDQSVQNIDKLKASQITPEQLRQLNVEAKKWRRHLNRYPRLHNIIGLLSLTLLCVLNLAIIFATSKGLINLAVFCFLQGFSMYALVIYTIHEGTGHNGIIRQIKCSHPLENFIWWTLSNLITQFPRLFFADPQYYKKVHPLHHAYTNTSKDGAYTRFIVLKRFLISLLPLANVLPFNDYKIHDGDKWSKSKFYTMFWGILYQFFCILIISQSHSILYTALTCLVFAPWFGFILDRLRETLEHHLMDTTEHSTSRNLGLSSPLRFLVTGGPTGQPYHLIHHLYPTLPWYAQIQIGHTLSRLMNEKQKSFYQLPHTSLLYSLKTIYQKSLPYFTKQNKISIVPIKSEKILKQYVDLRTRVYLGSGKKSSNIDIEKVLNQDNGNCSILGIFSDEKLVGGITLWFPQKTEWSTLPSSLNIPLNPQSCVEISGLYLLKEYRNKNIFINLFRSIHQNLRIEKRSKIIIASEKRLEKFYRSICFSQTGIYIYKKQINENMPLQILISDQRYLGFWGLNINPFKWFIFMLPLLIKAIKDQKLAKKIHLSISDFVIMIMYFPLTIAGIFYYLIRA